MDIHKVILPLLIALASTAAAVIARGIAFRLLHKWDRGTATLIGDIVIKAIRVPSMFWCIASGLYVGIAISELSVKYSFYLSQALFVIVFFSFTIAVANLGGKIFRDFMQKSELPLATTGLAYGIINGTIYVIGILIILAMLGISVTPLITALGVGGLAVALALQDTLANLFAGIHILVEKSIRVGDYIRLETGQEGLVEDITWRNNKLSLSVVTNYSLPEKKMLLILPVSVGYDSDPDRIEAILIDEVEKAKGEVAGLLPDCEPIVRLSGFGASSLDFTLACAIGEYSVQQAVQHEMRKRIFRRFREEGIEIPFPHRTVYLKEAK